MENVAKDYCIFQYIVPLNILKSNVDVFFIFLSTY